MSLAPPWSGKLSEGQFPAHLAGTGATQLSVQSKVGTGPGGHTQLITRGPWQTQREQAARLSLPDPLSDPSLHFIRRERPSLKAFVK